jgi:hypothetical protein
MANSADGPGIGDADEQGIDPSVRVVALAVGPA